LAQLRMIEVKVWTGFKQQNCASDNKIGPNEEEVKLKRHKLI